MKTFVILRGVSGAGKTYESRNIIKELSSHSPISSFLIASTDDYFIDAEGKYTFEAHLLKRNHDLNFKRVVTAFSIDIQVVILDNTNIKTSHYRHYEKIAKVFGYEVKKLLIGKLDVESVREYHARSLHQVPLDILIRNADEFEADNS